MRRKFICIMAASLITLTAINIIVLKASVYPSFEALEHTEAVENIERVDEAITSEVKSLAVIVTDYASWDDSYAYATGDEPAFIERNFSPSSVKNLGAAFIHIETSAGTPLYEAAFDDTGAVVTGSGRLTLAEIDPNHLLTPSGTGADATPIEGLLSSPHGPLLIISRPILKTSGEGPTVGRIIMGRPLDATLIATLRNRTKVNVHITDLGANAANDSLDAMDQQALDTLTRSSATRSSAPGSSAPGSSAPMLFQPHDTNLIGWSIIRDLNGAPALLLTISTPMEITRSGNVALTYAVCGIALTSMIILGLLAAFLQRMLVGPLLTLTQEVVTIGQLYNGGRLPSQARRDELGTLSREFNRTLDTLDEARIRLLEQAHQAGVALMASGVLHNLRNQLSPLTLRVSWLCEQEPPANPERIHGAVDRLAAGSLPPEIRDKTATYIKLTTHDLHTRLAGMQGELGAINKEITQIEQVLNELDVFGHTVGAPGVIRLIDPVRAAVRLIPNFPGVRITITVDPTLETTPPTQANGFLLEHIIFNLLINAVEAIIRRGNTEGTIAIVASMPQEECLDLQVHDDGIGLAPTATTLIFTRTYTTKTTKKHGTGLHWCANSVTAMGGRLFVESPGLNAGSTFHVVLPLARQSALAA